MASGSSGKEGTDHKYPTWSGDWSDWQDYVLRCELKADGLKKEDRELLGPRLASNLTGRAFDALSEIDRDKLRKEDGYKYLIQVLEKTRGKEKIDLLGDSFTEFFVKKDTYRKDNEELADYEARFKSLQRKLEKALKESGATGTIPSEVYGWYLLNCYMRMDPSDIANVRAHAETYKLEDIMSALHRMWSGGGLAAKDQERKKRKEASGHAMHIESPVVEKINYGNEEEGEEPNLPGDDEEDSELAAWYQESLEAFIEEPEDAEVLANFRDARRALSEAKTARGFYPVRNPNGKGYGSGGKGKFKGKGRGSSSGDYENNYANKVCMRCGKLGHIARICPQRPRDREGDSGKIGYVGMLWSCHRSEGQEEEGLIWSQTAQVEKLECHAVLDSGASDNVVGVNTLQEITEIYHTFGFAVVEEFDIDREQHKQFVYGSDHTSSALGVVHFSAGIMGKFVPITAHIVEGNTPLLLSARFLAEHKCLLEFRSGEASFGKISDERVKLQRGAGGHFLLDIVDFPGRRVQEQVRETREIVSEAGVHVSFETPDQTSEGTSKGGDLTE